MPNRNAKVFISSADLMPRNLNRRVELLVPIENSTVHEQILDQIMLANYLDTNQSWELEADGNYKKIKYSKSDSFSAHEYFQVTYFPERRVRFVYMDLQSFPTI